MKKKPAHSQKRVVFIGALFILWLAVVGVRAGYWQIYKGQWLQSKAEGQLREERVIKGKRGSIYDTNYKVLAASSEAPSIAVYPKIVKDKSKASYQLAKVLGLKRSKVHKKLTSGRHFAWLKRQATPKEADAVRKLKIKGVGFIPEHSRFYPNTTSAAQVLGFTGIDGHGLEGLEVYYNKELEGDEQKVIVLKDKLGRGYMTDRSSGLPRSGNNIVLTLDSHIQFIAEQALYEAVKRHRARSGMVIVMSPKTGALLAIANYPVFNPNTWQKYQPELWRNKAITDPFEPGSTLKIFSVAAALESGKINPRTIFYCENGSYRIGDHTFNDTKPHGWLSLTKIVKYSSNIGTVKFTEKIGKKTLFEGLRDFGFGTRTYIDCPGEKSGYLSDYTEWNAVDMGAIAFGQGMSVTGLQLVTAVSALANDGMMMRPYIVQAITDSNGRPLKKADPKELRQVVSVETAQTVRRIMRTVITPGGTGVEADLKGYEVCGKTGTAQKIDKNGRYAPDKYVSSFVGFAPAKQPALVVLVVVDEPQNIYYGGLVAAPVFKKIVREALSYLNIEPNSGFHKLRVSRGIKVSG